MTEIDDLNKKLKEKYAVLEEKEKIKELKDKNREAQQRIFEFSLLGKTVFFIKKLIKKR